MTMEARSSSLPFFAVSQIGVQKTILNSNSRSGREMRKRMDHSTVANNNQIMKS